MVDLGTGHGEIARKLARSFTKITALDPSDTMIAQARSQSSEFGNISFGVSSAEDLSQIESGSVDALVAGEAAHWFSYPQTWREIHRVLRPGGTMAFWGYVDNVLIGHPEATKVIQKYCYEEGEDKLGMYWEQPGRTILRELFRELEPPSDLFSDVERREYVPEGSPKHARWEGVKRDVVFEDKPMIEAEMKLGEVMSYLRTASSWHNWCAAHPERKPRVQGGGGDVLDDCFDEVLEVEEEWKGDPKWMERKVRTEWGTVILMARKR